MHQVRKVVSMQIKTKVFITLLALMFSLSFVVATTYKSLSVDEMLAKTEIAFQGRVTEVVVEMRTNQQDVEEPWTKVNFEVITSLKGDLAESHSLYFYGGVSEETTIQVEAMPTFRVDEEMIVFAYDAVYYSPLVGFSQGLFRLDEESWQSEAGKWLAVEQGEFVLVDAALRDSEAVVAQLQEAFTNTQEDSGQGGN